MYMWNAATRLVPPVMRDAGRGRSAGEEGTVIASRRPRAPQEFDLDLPIAIDWLLW